MFRDDVDSKCTINLYTNNSHEIRRCIDTSVTPSSITISGVDISLNKVMTVVRPNNIRVLIVIQVFNNQVVFLITRGNGNDDLREGTVSLGISYLGVVAVEIIIPV